MTDGITDNLSIDDLREFSATLEMSDGDNPSRLATPILNAAFRKVAPITEWMVMPISCVLAVERNGFPHRQRIPRERFRRN